MTSAPFMTADALLQHWQGHRRLTRRVIDAFPDDRLFSFSIGGMRTFGALALEMLALTVPTFNGAGRLNVSRRGDHLLVSELTWPSSASSSRASGVGHMPLRWLGRWSSGRSACRYVEFTFFTRGLI